MRIRHRLRNPPILTQLVNFCWSLFKWCLALALVAGVLLCGYLYLRLDDEIRRSVERRIAEHYTGMSVHVGRARFEQDRGIAIFDIAIADEQPDSNSQPMLSIGEMYLAGKVRMEDLVTNDLAISEIVVRRADLRAVCQANGEWNLKTLVPLPQIGARSPIVKVEDATLVVQDATRPAVVQTIQGVDLVLTPVTSDTLVAAGAKQFRVEGSARGVPARELRFVGELGTDDGVLNVTVTVAGLEISSEMLAALPGVPGNAMAGAEMSGRADGTIQLTRTGVDVPLLWSADVTLDRARLKHATLPEPLTEMRVVARAMPDRLTIKRLDAKCGTATIVLAAERFGWSRESTIALAAKVVGLQLDDRMPSQMPGSMARIWNRFQPIGPVDAELRLQFDGSEWRPQLTAACRGISLTDKAKFPYMLEQTTGRVVYNPSNAAGPDQLTLDLTGYGGGRPVRIEADLRHLTPREPDGVTTDTDVAIDERAPPGRPRVAGYRGQPALRRPPPRPHPTGWVKITGTDVPLHEQLISAIPPSGQPFVRSLQAQGAVDFTFRAEWKELSQPRADVTLDIGLKDCAIKYERFPLPLRGVKGLVSARDWRWKLQNVAGFGADDAAIIRCSGDVVPMVGGWHAELNFVGQNLPLDGNLKSALSPSGQSAWEELRPQGRIDVTAHVIHETQQPQPAVEVSLRPRDRSVSLHLTRFPYRLEKVEGEATYKPGRVEFRNVLARHDREVFSAESGVWTAASDGAWQIGLKGCNVDRISPHRELIGALPPRLQKILERLQPEGSFGIYNSSVSFAKSPSSERVAAAWDVNLDCHQAVFRGGLPLQSVTGGVRLFGRDDAQLAYSAGELDLDSIVWKDVQLTNVHGPFWVDNSFCLLGEQATQKLGQPARRITADAYGGSLAANIAIRHDNGPSYQLDLALGAADLARFANERLGGPTDMNGTVSGRLALSGSGPSLQLLNGGGELHVVDANIYKLPLLVSMLKVPNLRNRTPDTTAFNRCDMKFTVQGDRMYFEQLNLLGDTVSLYGKGQSGFDRRLDLVFYTLLEPVMPIPLWKTIAGQVSQQTLQLNVVGTWDDPEV
ncbi:MAG: AsmA-like C-terminal region-containing protein [Planctomycetes bacterium]|nr:AsmA-like C-terminal region-containing protein [Planctomycetota bacterium]